MGGCGAEVQAEVNKTYFERRSLGLFNMVSDIGVECDVLRHGPMSFIGVV